MAFVRAWQPKAAARFSRRGAGVAANGSVPDRGAPPVVVERLKRRSDFLAAAKGMRAPGRAFVLQALRRTEEGAARVGFTVSRQVGNAAERNRVRRRLREIVRLSASARGVILAGHDYVLIGRRAALAAPFGAMVQEFDAALARVHGRVRPEERGGTGGTRHGPLHETGPKTGPRTDPRPNPRPNPTKPSGSRRKPSAYER
jgi:ribonuclease P protein component